MKVTVLGLGPGGGADLTGRARAALEACDLIVGYTAYIDLVRADFPQKETLSTGMRREVDRCRAAVEAARTGKDVAVACSGDSGVYGMAGLIYEVAQEYDPIESGVVPGITAACGGAAVLVIYSLMVAVDIPLFYKMGGEKARLPMTLTFVVPFIAIFPTISYWGPWLDGLNFDAVPWVLVAAAVLALVAACVYLSYRISVRILESKEF